MTAMIGVGETARLLRVSPDTVRAWADAGKFHTERSAAGRRLIPVVEVEQLAKRLARKFKAKG